MGILAPLALCLYIRGFLPMDRQIHSHSKMSVLQDMSHGYTGIGWTALALTHSPPQQGKSACSLP